VSYHSPHPTCDIICRIIAYVISLYDIMISYVISYNDIIYDIIAYAEKFCVMLTQSVLFVDSI
jgi:hypothetical protein